MIGITIRIEGMDKLKKYLKERPREIAQAISRAIKTSGFILEAESKKALTSGANRAIRTGKLRSENVVRELSDLRVAIYPLVQYAVYVHEGTFRMRARPWFNEAGKNAGPQIKETFDGEIKAALE